MEVMKTMNSMFRNCTDKEREAIENWPVFSDEDVTAVNDLFDHYMFYRWEDRDTMQVWTSCCHRKGTVHRISREEVYERYELITAKHNERIKCPYCGRVVQKKDVGKIGKGLNLRAYKDAAVVHVREDGVYITAVYARKEYDPARNSLFTALPEVSLKSAYRFRPGEVMQVENLYYGGYGVTYERDKLGKRKWVQEPFHCSTYRIIGLERLRESWMKYCQYDRYTGIGYDRPLSDDSMVSYLTAYSLYPQQVEMLVKMGLGRIVRRMAEERVKSSRIFDWDAKDPKAAFRVDGQELRELLRTEGRTVIQAMEARTTLRELKEQRSLVWLLREGHKELLHLHDNKGTREIKTYCRRVGLPLVTVWRYLMKHTGPRCYGAWFGINEAWSVWKDTIDMADQLGYDIRHEAISMPKELEVKHNEYAKAINEAKELQKKMADEQLEREMEMSMQKRKSKYEFESGGLMVVMPMTMEDVRAEGRALQHCVGGYAQRHVAGATTILFLRKAEAPDTAYVTIEIKGTVIQQIHGFKNEWVDGKKMPDPAKTHKAFLDLWLSWVKAGSERDEDGRPVLPGQKNRKEKIA